MADSTVAWRLHQPAALNSFPPGAEAAGWWDAQSPWLSKEKVVTFLEVSWFMWDGKKESEETKGNSKEKMV